MIRRIKNLLNKIKHKSGSESKNLISKDTILSDSDVDTNDQKITEALNINISSVPDNWQPPHQELKQTDILEHNAENLKSPGKRIDKGNDQPPEPWKNFDNTYNPFKESVEQATIANPNEAANWVTFEKDENPFLVKDKAPIQRIDKDENTKPLKSKNEQILENAETIGKLNATIDNTATQKTSRISEVDDNIPNIDLNISDLPYPSDEESKFSSVSDLSRSSDEESKFSQKVLNDRIDKSSQKSI